jgi:hypothetical protein
VNWKSAALALLPAIAALLGGGTLGFTKGENDSDAFWIETIGLIKLELDEEQARNDDLVERLLRKCPG